MTMCQVIPQPNHQFDFVVDGQVRTSWHYSPQYPRPFLYPLNGPSNVSITRMGHPGAPNHDHHRSIWFAHHKVLGIDFWSDTGDSRIRQREWLAMQDGNNASVAAVKLDWLDGHDPQPLIEQELVISVGPGSSRTETKIEIQATFTPVANELELGQSNFGFFAVRVARTISAVFGDGLISDSEGRTGESNIFGQAARWMDYSGPVQAPSGELVREGVSLFEHPSNPRFPHRWHVRDDGWMGPSQCREEPYLLTKENPLQLRFLLNAHAGLYQHDQAELMFEDFSTTNSFIVEPSSRPHHAYEIRRAD